MNDDEILAALDRPFEPVKTPLIYRVALLVVGCVMILLPLLYVALVGLLGYGVWYHATQNVGVFHFWSYRVAALAYFGPILGGAISLLFLFKPLLAPRRRGTRPHFLHEADQPLLFAYVKRLCQALGAPPPREISVDMQVNASASLKRGTRSFLGDDLTLTVGLPVVNGLSVRQFSGVLAHEFGHFSQRVGMRATYVIRSVNAWFARVVYERDAWDEWLVDSSSGDSTWPQPILMAARALVWLSRRVLRCLMWAGHLVSAFMLRQMEYDADRYQARLAGSATVGDVLQKLRLLSVAHQVAHAALHQAWQEGWLADNLPAFIDAQARQVALLDAQPERSDPVWSTRLEALLGTHPSPSQRVASARRDQQPGIVAVDVPATVLFRDFSGLCQCATTDYYRRVLGLDLKSTVVIPTEQLVEELSARRRALSVLRRYFRGQLLDSYQLFLGAVPLPAAVDLETWSTRLCEARERMSREIDRTADARHSYANAQRQLLGSEEVTPDADLEVRAAPSGLTTIDLRMSRAPDAERLDPTSVRHRALVEMEPLLAAARQRLIAAFTLLSAPPVRHRLDGAGFRGAVDETRTLLDALAALERDWPLVDRLRIHTEWLRRTLHAVAIGAADSEAVIKEVEWTSRSVRDELATLKKNFTSVGYPYLARASVRSVADYAVPTVPDPENPAHVIAASDDSIARFFRLYYRLMADLAVVAEQVEEAIGLEPLPEEASSVPAGS